MTDLTAVHIFVLFHLTTGTPPTTLDLYERTFDTVADCSDYVAANHGAVGDLARETVREFLQVAHAPSGSAGFDISVGCRGKDKTTI
jgi:hypothetical protein